MNKDMELFDEAFLLAKASSDRASRKSARTRLEDQHPEIKTTEINRAWAAACALEHACYDFGDRCRLKSISDDEALALMQEQFPGFSKDTYRTALGHGYLISR
jgi:hypothetical protein